MLDVALLMRPGCAHAPLLHRRLARVLSELGGRLSVIRQDSLPAGDHRAGYGSPTVLVGGADLFGEGQPADAAPS